MHPMNRTQFQKYQIAVLQEKINSGHMQIINEFQNTE